MAGHAQPNRQLTKVIREYGEERFAFQIAKAIVARRADRDQFQRTRQLAEIVANAVKTREKGKDPATRTFQAIRIFINQELEELEIRAERSVAHAGARRAAGRDQLSFAGRSHRQAVHGRAKPRRRSRTAACRFAQSICRSPLLKLIGRDQAVRRRSRRQSARPFGRDARGRSAIRGAHERRSTSVLLTLVMGCALSLVNAQYQARQPVHRARARAAQARQLDIDWAQLQLEQSHAVGKNARASSRSPPRR